MADLYEEYGLEQEQELGANPKLPTDKPKKVKKSGGWLGRIIAFLLGIIIALGSCAGVIFAVLTQPVRKLTGLAGMDFDTQVKDNILSEKYGDKTLIDLSKDALSAAIAKDLAGLNEVFPKVGVYIGELTDKMHTQFGVELDAQEMMNTHMDMLPEYIGGKFKSTALGKLLSATKGGTLDPLLMEICYGEEGKDYTIDENGEVVMLDGKEAVTVQMLSDDSTAIIDKVSLSSVVHPKADDSVMLEVAYGKEGVTFEPVKDENGTILVDEFGGAMITMLPFFLNKDENGNFVDYNGNPVNCSATEAENGYTKIEEYFPNTTDVKNTYFVKDDGNGNYYAREEANDEAEEVLFHKVTIGDMSTDSKQIIDNIYLKDALGLNIGANPDNDPHGVLMCLAYGEKGVDYKIVGEGEERKIEMSPDADYRTIGDLRKRGTALINDIGLADIMKENRESAIIMYILYGKKDAHYYIDAETQEIIMKKQRVAIDTTCGRAYNEYGEELQPRITEGEEPQEGFILDLTAGTFIDVNDNEYVLEETTDTFTGNRGGADFVATWYYLKQNDEYTYYSKSTLGDLTGDVNLVSTLTDRMTVAEIFGEQTADNNRFLKHLKESTITQLPEAISGLTVCQVFKNEIYIKPQVYSGADYTTTQVDPISGEYIVLTAGDYYYEENGRLYYAENADDVVASKWKYLLTDSTGEINESYTVAGDMNALLNNMTANISVATLRQLYNDSIITLEDATLLDTAIITQIGTTEIQGIPNNITKLGDLPPEKLLSYISQVLTAITP